MLNYSVHHLDMFNKLLMISQHYIIYAKKYMSYKYNTSGYT